MFTHGEITDLRRLRRSGARVGDVCSLFPKHSRDDMIEAIWAVIRFDSDWDAVKHVNWVLAQKQGGVPLINGKEAWKVTADRGRVSYAPGF